MFCHLRKQVPTLLPTLPTALLTAMLTVMLMAAAIEEGAKGASETEGRAERGL